MANEIVLELIPSREISGNYGAQNVFIVNRMLAYCMRMEYALFPSSFSRKVHLLVMQVQAMH